MRPRLLARSPAAPWPGRAGVLAAVVLHGAAVWLLLPHGARAPMAAGDPPTIEIEMVDQAAAAKGGAAAVDASPTPPDPTPPAPAPGPAPGPGDPARLPAPAIPPTTASRVAEVNLGDAEADREALRVTGDNVVPPRPDALFHNKGPAYPIEAARRRHEGEVLLQLRVGTSGVPEAVTVVRSSGDQSLDRAALEAVQLWRFLPARNNGVAVPFDYLQSINFSLTVR